MFVNFITLSLREKKFIVYGMPDKILIPKGRLTVSKME